MPVWVPVRSLRSRLPPQSAGSTICRSTFAATHFVLAAAAVPGSGSGLFNSGGVVVDGGCKDPTRAAPIISRIPFPDEWRIVLVLDRKRTGVHGEEESAAFARLPSFAAADAAHICRLVLMQALAGARGSRSHVLRGGNQGDADHSRCVFCPAARWSLLRQSRGGRGHGSARR